MVPANRELQLPSRAMSAPFEMSRVSRDRIGDRYVMINAAAVLVVAALVVKLVPCPGWWLLPVLFITPSVVRRVLDVALTAPSRQASLTTRVHLQSLPAEARTLLVFPALLASEEDVASIVSTVRNNWNSMRGQSVHMAVLVDFADADQTDAAGDEVLWTRLTTAIDAVRRERGAHPSRLLLLRRKRKWNPRERCHMGWERKRGKLVELNRAILGEETSYQLSDDERKLLTSIRFVAVLDLESQFVNDSLVALVSVLMHPANQWAAIVVPRVLRRRSLSQNGWTYALFGPFFPFPRLARCLDVEVAGSGRFTGKGLYDPRRFESSGASDFPDNAILSHDTVEGGRAGVTVAFDAIVFEDVPSNPAAYVRRLHRWMRGDVQLLPWTLPWVRRQSGQWMRNRLSVVDRFRIVFLAHDKITLSACAAMTVTAWFSAPSRAAILYGAVAVSFFVPLLLRLILALHRIVRAKARPSVAATSLRRALQSDLTRALTELVVLPMLAVTILDAACRATIRMLVTRRRMLQWTTATQSERRGARGWNGLVLAIGPLLSSLAAVWALATAHRRTDVWLIGALWAVGPIAAQVLTRVQIGATWRTAK
jgi:cyclic beta-1,2-glucan synthetase